METMMTDAWAELEAAATPTLATLFAREPDRLARLVVEEAGLRFDFSKTHLDDALLAGFQRLAAETGLAARRDALFAGGLVNPTEGRAAEHAA
jgi:glucose-6-phosphate isomerase